MIVTPPHHATPPTSTGFWQAFKMSCAHWRPDLAAFVPLHFSHDRTRFHGASKPALRLRLNVIKRRGVQKGVRNH
jgi:hypothetical protein